MQHGVVEREQATPLIDLYGPSHDAVQAMGATGSAWLAPGAPPGRKHRHPGFVIGYVLAGSYRFAVNDQAARVVKAGEMFFESFDSPGEVHSASGNASTVEPVKFLAIVFTKKGDPVTIPG